MIAVFLLHNHLSVTFAFVHPVPSQPLSLEACSPQRLEHQLVPNMVLRSMSAAYLPAIKPKSSAISLARHLESAQHLERQRIASRLLSNDPREWPAMPSCQYYSGSLVRNIDIGEEAREGLETILLSHSLTFHSSLRRRWLQHRRVSHVRWRQLYQNQRKRWTTNNLRCCHVQTWRLWLLVSIAVVTKLQARKSC